VFRGKKTAEMASVHDDRGSSYICGTLQMSERLPKWEGRQGSLRTHPIILNHLHSRHRTLRISPCAWRTGYKPLASPDPETQWIAGVELRQRCPRPCRPRCRWRCRLGCRRSTGSMRAEPPHRARRRTAHRTERRPVHSIDAVAPVGRVAIAVIGTIPYWRPGTEKTRTDPGPGPALGIFRTDQIVKTVSMASRS
jgi:hypothetical protein